jgi:hypothetical protein
MIDFGLPLGPGEAGRTLEEKWDQNKPGEKPLRRVTSRARGGRRCLRRGR